jgi:parvulin-like peptidyl-prolyl isomerase
MALSVNGQIVSQELVEAEVAALTLQLVAAGGQTPQSAAKLANQWALDNVIERVLLRQAAARLPSDGSLEEDENGQLQRLFDKLHAEVLPPKRREVVDFYKKHRGRFRSPANLHASHIVKNVDDQHAESDALAAIQAAEAELFRGEPFAQVADRFSDCAGSGGDLDWFARGEMVEEFETVLANLKPGQVSPIFRSPFGFHIATLHARKPEAIRPLSEVFSQVENDLLAEKRQTVLNEFLDRLRAESIIERSAAETGSPA